MQSVKATARWLPTLASQQHAAALRQEAARLAGTVIEAVVSRLRPAE